MPISDVDLNLVEKVKAGDRASFDRLYNKYKRVILNYIYRLIGDREVSEELTQEAFVKAYINIKRFKPKATFLSWLYTITGNLAKNALREKGYRPKISLEMHIKEADGIELKNIIRANIKTPDLILENKELKEKIERVLHSLTLNDREIITLCIIQKKSYVEATKILGCSKQAVAVRLYRARRSFAKMMAINPEERQRT